MAVRGAIKNTVLISPDEYIRLLDEVNDARLLTAAAERMDKFDPSVLISQEYVDWELGFAPSDYENTDGIEFLNELECQALKNFKN